MAALEASTARRAAVAPRGCNAGLSLHRLTSSTARRQRLAAVEQVQVQAQTKSSQQEEGDEIYLGFDKTDYARPPGRKGKVIRDNIAKYPGKDDMGWFLGVTGGWAGGEAALVQLKEQAEKDKKAAGKAAVEAPRKPPVKRLAEQGDKIYVGFKKSEIELQKAGAGGGYIIDDPRKYPDKEDIGFLQGATGGFAGGEKGIKQLVKDGELRLRDPRDVELNKQFSPISLMMLLVLGAGGGGTLLNELFDAGEGVVKSELTQAPVDDKTKVLLLAAVAVLASAGLIGGVRASLSSLGERVKARAQELALLGGFLFVVFLAARAVLEL